MVVAALELSALVTAVVCLAVVVVDLAAVASVVSSTSSVVVSEVVASVTTWEVVDVVLDEGASSAQPTRHIAARIMIVKRAINLVFITSHLHD